MPVVAYCDRVAVPTVIGVLRPMILLPATLMTGLSPDEFSAILSHELAHIRRYDLWMNLLQRVADLEIRVVDPESGQPVAGADLWTLLPDQPEKRLHQCENGIP